MAAPGGIKSDEDIFGIIHDDFLEVLTHQRTDEIVVSLFRNVFGLQMRVDIAVHD